MKKILLIFIFCLACFLPIRSYALIDSYEDVVYDNVGVKIKDKLFVERFNLNPKYSRTRMKRKFTKQAFEFLLDQLTKF